MFVSQFVLGIFSTIVVEFIALVIYSLVASIKEKGGKHNGHNADKDN